MKFIIYSRDKDDALAIRKANRDAHLTFLKAKSPVEVLSAGPYLDDGGVTMIGSLLIVEADTIDVVRDWLKHDPYARAGLPKTVNIHPFIWAIGAP